MVVLVLLFGAKRLPDAARSLGRSLRIIKAETKGLIDDDNNVAEKAEPQTARQPLNGEVYGQPGYQQPYQPPQGQPAPGYQQPTYQAPPTGQQGYPQPAAQPYVDPVQQQRTNDR
ncbi:MAG: Sec-independent protein translocase subunit TatA [Actinoplanes sp.]